ncbi:MAG: FAD-dependent oxidoreductase [bacterium]
MKTKEKSILVIGGGIAGMTAAVEAAEVGHQVILVEKEPYLGGRVLRLHRYFPKMCPPTCGYEINVRRIKQNPRITVYTLATVTRITGVAGKFKARIRIKPRYVTGQVPLDDSVAEQLTAERPNEFNLGMDRIKALHLPHDAAYPPWPMLDRKVLSDADIETLNRVAPEGAIDLEMEEEEIEVQVGSVILATGWQPYDAAKVDNLGYGRCRNVITNVEMERLAAHRGPTGGEIVRPSDGKPALNVAFVQCAGSRDENHLAYCSAVCCMASLKQARYIREQHPDAKVTIFYIDIRTVGYLEKFYFDMLDDKQVAFVKGKVAAVEEAAGSDDLLLDVEDTLTHETLHDTFDLVVLATGMVPNDAGIELPGDLQRDEYGFVTNETNVSGLFAAGCAKRPCDVSRVTKDATAAALKAIQALACE